MASQAALDEARSCLAVLESWEGFWPGARKCKELLEDLTGKASEAIRTGAAVNAAAAAVASNVPRGSSSQGPMAGPSAPSPSSSAGMYPDGRPPNPSAAPISVPVSERLIKNRPRRDRSRDVPLSPRNAHGPAHYRTDCECIPVLPLHSFICVPPCPCPLAGRDGASGLPSGRSAVVAYFAPCDGSARTTAC